MSWWRIASVVLLSALFTAGPALAGWVQEGAEGELLFIQDGKIKQAPQDPDEAWLVMDFKKGEVLAVNPQAKTYARADLEDYCRFMAQIADHFRQVAGAGADAGQPVEVSDQGPGPKVAGFATRRYRVTVGGQLREEVWLSREPSFLGDFQPQLVAKAMGCGAVAGEVESSPEYRRIMASGWVLRSIYHEGGEAEVDTDVKSLRQENLPAGEFGPPADFRQVPLEEALSGE